MHRVRQSVWYFEEFGWKPTVVCADEKYVEGIKDKLLLNTLPPGLEVIKVKAFSTSWTRKIGLGALALRSLVFYFFTVNKLLINRKIDLIYFSTTQFPTLVLGRYWKWRYKVSYVIDMQDPWYSTYYENKPKSERPKKYWFSYHLNKCLEPIAMKGCDGLISVSQFYITQLQERYPVLLNKPNKVITFGAFEKDIEVSKGIDSTGSFIKNKEYQYIVYVGRGGFDMQSALSLIFSAFKKGLQEQPTVFKEFRFLFVGTSYAPKGKGKKTVEPIAEKVGILEYVSEHTDRVPYFEGLALLQKADLLFIPGSDDPAYTASKLYPYILSRKPIMGIFHQNSSAKSILEETKSGTVCTLSETVETVYKTLSNQLDTIKANTYNNKTDWNVFRKYNAEEMTEKQIELFNRVVNK